MKNVFFWFCLLFVSTQVNAQIDSSTMYSMNDAEVEHISKPISMKIFVKSDSILNNKTSYLSEEAIINFINLTKEELPVLTDEIITSKLQAIPTTLNIRFTPEVGEMVRDYLYNKRSLIVRMLTKAEYYFPMFEVELDKRDMPLEIKYLAVVESHLNPMAKSPMGATGIWQFMYATAKYKGLSITSLEDERRDPYISTQYAADYLNQLYTIYGDWLLAMSAYNAGPGNINKAIRSADGVQNYWIARKFMPRETQQYVPKIIAAMYVMYYASDYMLFPREPEYDYYDIKQVRIFDQITLKYGAELLDLEEGFLSSLNPILSKGLIPKIDSGYVLNIPKSKLFQFEESKDLFQNDPYLKVEQKELEDKHVAEFVSSKTNSYSSYTIRSGDNLSIIAQKFSCTVSDIKRWNNLNSNFISAGKKLKIYSTKNYTASISAPIVVVNYDDVGFKAHEIDENSCKCYKHEIASGDNLWDISIKYNSNIDKIKEVNNIPKSWKLRLGTYLKIPKM